MNNKNVVYDPRFLIKFHKPHYQIFVGNIRFSCEEEEIRDLFSKFGTVVSVIIPITKTGYNKGCAYVTYVREADAKAAIKNLNGTTFQNRVIYVEEKKEFDINQPRIDKAHPDQPPKYVHIDE